MHVAQEQRAGAMPSFEHRPPTDFLSHVGVRVFPVSPSGHKIDSRVVPPHPFVGENDTEASLAAVPEHVWMFEQAVAHVSTRWGIALGVCVERDGIVWFADTAVGTLAQLGTTTVTAR